MALPFKRIFWLVFDSVGVGAMPDAHEFGDDPSVHTLKRVWGDGSRFDFLSRCGFSWFVDNQISLSSKNTMVCKMAEFSNGKDTLTGHWEMAGVPLTSSFPLYPDGFPDHLIQSFINKTGCEGVLGNCVASGTDIINKLDEEHHKTSFPIIYTSADSVFQIAAHKEIIPLEKLYKYCQIARDEIFTNDHPNCPHYCTAL